MSDTLDEIRKQREVGEDARAEFEEVELSHRGVGSPNSEDVAGELVVFANADGSVVIGVDDDRVVRGISADRSGDVERWLIEMVRVAGRTRAEGNESKLCRPAGRRNTDCAREPARGRRTWRKEPQTARRTEIMGPVTSRIDGPRRSERNRPARLTVHREKGSDGGREGTERPAGIR